MSQYAKEKAYPVTSVGPDCMDDWDLGDIPDDLKWLVYWYESGSYESSGAAVFKTAEGTYGDEDLGHCSCHGPTTEKTWVGRMNADQLKKFLRTDQALDRPRNSEDYDYAQWAVISPVVLRLLSVTNRDDLVAGE